VLIVPPNHRLAKKRKINLNDLAKEQLLYRERGSATRAEVEKKLSALDCRIGPAADLDNPEALKQAVASGLGIAFISKFAVKNELKAKILVAPKIQDLTIKRNLKIIYRKGKHLSRAARALIETAQNSRD
jgi:LysR family transcriptional regulator, low CO2-responsive transcriptional regulator